MKMNDRPKSATLTVAKAPCKSCPYRRDVPSGVWAASEYERLPAYDGNMGEQAWAGGRRLFDCHQSDGNLCAGWLACHGPDKLIALYLTPYIVPDAVWDYTTRVKLFKSGAQACAHGLRAIKWPAARARRMIDQLLRQRARKGGKP